VAAFRAWNDLRVVDSHRCLHASTVSSQLIGFCFAFSFSLIFVSVPCVRLSWPFRQHFNARKYIVSYRIVSYDNAKLSYDKLVFSD